MNGATYLAVRDMVVTLLTRFPDDGALTPDIIRSQVQAAASLVELTTGTTLRAEEVPNLVREIESLFNAWIGTPQILEDDTGHLPWLPDRRDSIEWRYWNRYRTYLQQEWATPRTIQGLEELTDETLGRLEDPLRPGPWDRRGLVVGHVQSGKTAHYAGLICKAVDSGYRLIVVLAGLHKSLRSQTQIRLEEAFLGYSSLGGEAKTLVGVGNLDHSLHPNTITDRTDGGDFKKAVAQQFNIHPGQDPLLFVIKKNGSTLRNLLKWVRGFAHDLEAGTGRKFVKDVPILVIDDEADQASVNFRPEGSDPTAINGLIRELLHTFAQSAYVGYTATPFANIFIHEQARTDQHAEDLFPRSFIISLPTPSNYIGPLRVFGLPQDPEGDEASVEPLPLVRSADDGREWMPERHKKEILPRYRSEDELPPSMREAILSFILTGAAKYARGLEHEHHSMLVHVTRFTAVQAIVARQVGEYLASVKRRLLYGEGAATETVLSQLHALWEQDFETTSRRVQRLVEDPFLTPLTWSEVSRFVHRVADEIHVKVLNGTSADALDYDLNKESGLKVIAVGGDKLSRGLTLEGLSTSYFLRSSRMYDTLMQMGRWFGYRPRYLDLCRLYVPEDLKEWFEHITEASEELRREFEQMKFIGGTPADYGLRVRSHPTLLVTSQVKMRSGVAMRVSFAGQLSETVVFPRTPRELRANVAAADKLISGLNAPETSSGRSMYLWREVDSERICRFLQDYETHPKAPKSNCDLLRKYIEKQVARGELRQWTVALIGGNPGNALLATIGGLTLPCILRRTASGGPYPDRLAIRRLLSPSDEALDLSEAECVKALEATKATGDHEATRPSGEYIRDARPATRGLLLLYPIDPGQVGKDDGLEDKSNPVVGFGISFPKSDGAEAVEYKVNHVYFEQLYGASDWDDDDDDEVLE